MFKNFSFFKSSSTPVNKNTQVKTELKNETIDLTDNEINECLQYEIKKRINTSNNIEAIRGIYFDQSEKDDLFNESVKIIVESQQGSASLLQRKLKLGYNRAGRLIDQLEFFGIVGPFEGSKNRAVNIKSLAELEIFFELGEVISEKQKLFRRKYLDNYKDKIDLAVTLYFSELEKKNEEAEIEMIKVEIIEEARKKKENQRIKELREQAKKQLLNEGLISNFQTDCNREPISQEVQNRVWNRDSGKCVKCGNNEKLEFDHIIPFSKGGANTYRNLQLLCEKCNREKSNKIG